MLYTVYVICSHLSQDILYSAGKVVMERPKANRARSMMWSERTRKAKRAKVTQKPPLWAAVENGDEDTVHGLLTIGCDVDERYMGWTPLMKAAEEGRTMIALQLLAHRADLEAINNKGRTALSFAAATSGDRPTPRETLAFLMAWGADDTHTNNKFLTPLQEARKENREEAIKIFEYFEMLEESNTDACTH